MRPDRLCGDDAGSALAVTIMILFALSVAIIALLEGAEAFHRDSAYRSDDDELLVAIDSALDRYAAKLVVNAAYPSYWVDELELPRTCASDDPALNGSVVTPGHRWPDGCSGWTYDVVAGDDIWRTHPLLGDTELALAVDVPGTAGQAVTVVGRRSDHQMRAVSARLTATGLSEFGFVSDASLRFGENVALTGPVYVGGDLSFGPNNSTNSNYYAEGRILDTITELDGARGYDGSGGPRYGDIRSVIDEPMNFDNFWTDLGTVADLACGGAGYCLDEPGAAVYLVHPHVVAGEQRLDIYWARSRSGAASGCVYDADEWWEREMHHSSVTWNVWGLGLRVPPNGALWSDRHIIIGNRDAGLGPAGTAEIAEAMTVYAGTVSRRRNVIVNADVVYTDRGGPAVIGLIASGSIVMNPDARGADRDLDLEASILGQGSPGFRTAFTCGRHGGTIRNGAFRLYGSVATPNTGWMSHAWSPRTYGFDPRLAGLSPPLYPLIDDEWEVTNWQEVTIPAWAR